MKKIDRTGETRKNVDGLEMVIVEYKNNKQMMVYFPELGVDRETRYNLFKEGKVFPTWRNVGFADADEFNDDEDIIDSEGNNVGVVIAIGAGLFALVSLGLAGLAFALSAIFE